MDKKALQEQFEEFARWYVLPLDKSEDGTYRALETQSAWMSFQHQQAKVEELQKRVDAVIKIIDETNGEINLRDMPRAYARTQLNRMKNELEQALKGEGQ